MGKRIIARRRGAGTGTYRSPSHRHHGEIRFPPKSIREGAMVIDIVHAPGHSAPIAVLKGSSGTFYRMLATSGLTTGDKVGIGSGDVARGSLLPLSNIPDGTLVSNVEITPEDGGKLVRTAGTSALIVAHQSGGKVTLQLPSGHFKDVPGLCRAQVGIVAGGGRAERPFVKAGKKVLSYKSLAKAPFKVRGVAMNPVNHPHGGGSHQHVGRPSTVSAGAWPGTKVGRYSKRRKRKER
jgi:large subunit ribosomal protein L2